MFNQLNAMSAVDHAFVKAISTIKTMSRASNGVGRPPPDSRTTLYGLYKQATEGDVQGIMSRPTGDTPQDEGDRRKWDSWHAQHGLTRTEAKMKYIEYLLETMRQVSPGTPVSEALVSELQAIYVAAQSGQSGTPEMPQSHSRTWSLASNNSAYSQFLRRPTYSEFGLSVGDRTERATDFEPEHGAPGPVVGRQVPLSPINAFHGPAVGQSEYAPEEAVSANANWKQDVAWQLESINEEINSIRQRYDTRKGRLPHVPESNPDKPPSIHDFFKYWLAWTQKSSTTILLRLGEGLRRLVVDAAALTTFLIIVRLVQANPAVMKRIPWTRRFFTIVGNLIAVMLKEVGFNIRPLNGGTPKQATN